MNLSHFSPFSLLSALLAATMLLAVDIGNSNIKFGLYDRESLGHKFKIATKRDISSDDITSVVAREVDATITDTLVCSVVPEVHESLVGAIRDQFGIEARFVSNADNFGLNVRYEPLAAAGTDRLVNAFSAVENYGPPCIVCSFGTALTIDVVDRERVLLGGIIAPGMRTMAKAVELAASQLPEVTIEKPDAVIQKTTVESIRSGIVYGYFGMVSSLINRIKHESGIHAKVIATGGFARLVADNVAEIDVVDDDLLLAGLMLLHLRSHPV